MSEHVRMWIGGSWVDAADGATFEAFSPSTGDVILVHEDVRDAYLGKLTAAVARELQLGDPFDDATTLGPVNNEPTAAKTERHVADAVEHGATVLTGGARAPQHGSDLFFEPTVLDGVTNDMAIAREETFGPVAPVTAIRSEQEAIDLVNGSEYGSALGDLHGRPRPRAPVRGGGPHRLGQRERRHELLGVAPAVRRARRLEQRRRPRGWPVLDGAPDRAEDDRDRPRLGARRPPATR